jgi:hypothetical protein
VRITARRCCHLVGGGSRRRPWPGTRSRTWHRHRNRWSRIVDFLLVSCHALVTYPLHLRAVDHRAPTALSGTLRSSGLVRTKHPQPVEQYSRVFKQLGGLCAATFAGLFGARAPSPATVRLPGPDNETIPPSTDPYGDVAPAGNVTEASGAGVTRVVRRVVTVADVDFAACCTPGGPRRTCATIRDRFSGPVGCGRPRTRVTQRAHRLVN